MRLCLQKELAPRIKGSSACRMSMNAWAAWAGDVHLLDPLEREMCICSSAHSELQISWELNFLSIFFVRILIVHSRNYTQYKSRFCPSLDELANTNKTLPIPTIICIFVSLPCKGWKLELQFWENFEQSPSVEVQIILKVMVSQSWAFHIPKFFEVSKPKVVFLGDEMEKHPKIIPRI